MAHRLRMLNGAILGALFGLVVGTGFAGVVLLLYLPHEYPVDRWYNGVRIFALVVGSGTLVGLVAGLASSVPERGLSFLRSTTIVAIAGIVAIAFAPNVKRGMFLSAPLVGVIVGGIVVVLAGIVKSNSARSAKQTKQEGENTAGKA